MKLAWLADKIARGLAGQYLDWDGVRDICDGRIGSELSASLLDRLTDMTVSRLAKKGPALAALQSIARNTCCSGCQEAALVARQALRELSADKGRKND